MEWKDKVIKIIANNMDKVTFDTRMGFWKLGEKWINTIERANGKVELRVQLQEFADFEPIIDIGFGSNLHKNLLSIRSKTLDAEYMKRVEEWKTKIQKGTK